MFRAKAVVEMDQREITSACGAVAQAAVWELTAMPFKWSLPSESLSSHQLATIVIEKCARRWGVHTKAAERSAQVAASIRIAPADRLKNFDPSTWPSCIHSHMLEQHRGVA